MGDAHDKFLYELKINYSPKIEVRLRLLKDPELVEIITEHRREMQKVYEWKLPKTQLEFKFSKSMCANVALFSYLFMKTNLYNFYKKNVLNQFNTFHYMDPETIYNHFSKPLFNDIVKTVKEIFNNEAYIFLPKILDCQKLIEILLVESEYEFCETNIKYSKEIKKLFKERTSNISLDIEEKWKIRYKIEGEKILSIINSREEDYLQENFFSFCLKNIWQEIDRILPVDIPEAGDMFSEEKETLEEFEKNHTPPKERIDILAKLVNKYPGYYPIWEHLLHCYPSGSEERIELLDFYISLFGMKSLDYKLELRKEYYTNYRINYTAQIPKCWQDIIANVENDKQAFELARNVLELSESVDDKKLEKISPICNELTKFANTPETREYIFDFMLYTAVSKEGEIDDVKLQELLITHKHNFSPMYFENFSIITDENLRARCIQIRRDIDKYLPQSILNLYDDEEIPKECFACVIKIHQAEEKGEWDKVKQLCDAIKNVKPLIPLCIWTSLAVDIVQAPNKDFTQSSIACLSLSEASLKVLCGIENTVIAADINMLLKNYFQAISAFISSDLWQKVQKDFEKKDISDLFGTFGNCLGAIASNSPELLELSLQKIDVASSYYVKSIYTVLFAIYKLLVNECTSDDVRNCLAVYPTIDENAILYISGSAPLAADLASKIKEESSELGSFDFKILKKCSLSLEREAISVHREYYEAYCRLLTSLRSSKWDEALQCAESLLDKFNLNEFNYAAMQAKLGQNPEQLDELITLLKNGETLKTITQTWEHCEWGTFVTNAIQSIIKNDFSTIETLGFHTDIEKIYNLKFNNKYCVNHASITRISEAVLGRVNEALRKQKSSPLSPGNIYGSYTSSTTEGVFTAWGLITIYKETSKVSQYLWKEYTGSDRCWGATLKLLGKNENQNVEISLELFSYRPIDVLCKICDFFINHWKKYSSKELHQIVDCPFYEDTGNLNLLFINCRKKLQFIELAEFKDGEIEQILSQDNEERTYNGKVYPTVADAENAKVEQAIGEYFSSEMENIASLPTFEEREQQTIALREKLKAKAETMGVTLPECYEPLETAILNMDAEARTVNGRTYVNRDEARIARLELELRSFFDENIAKINKIANLFEKEEQAFILRSRISDKAKELGLKEHEQYAPLEEYISKLDIEIRTVAGILYDSRELANKQRELWTLFSAISPELGWKEASSMIIGIHKKAQELNISDDWLRPLCENQLETIKARLLMQLNDYYKNLELDSEEKARKARELMLAKAAEIEYPDYKAYTPLENLIESYDKKYRTVSGITYETRVLADKQKEVLNKFTELDENKLNQRTAIKAINDLQSFIQTLQIECEWLPEKQRELLEKINTRDEKQLHDFYLTLDVSTEEKAIAARPIMAQKAKELCKDDFVQYEPLEELLVNFDILARTFANKLYDTREEAKFAKKQAEFDEFYGNAIQAIKKIKAVEARENEAFKLRITLQEKAKELQLPIASEYKPLEKYIASLDIEARTVAGRLYNTREEAALARKFEIIHDFFDKNKQLIDRYPLIETREKMAIELRSKIIEKANEINIPNFHEYEPLETFITKLDEEYRTLGKIVFDKREEAALKRKLIATAIKHFRPLAGGNVYVAPNLPYPKLAGAIKGFCANIEPALVVLLLDNTLLGSADEGIIVTCDAIYGKRDREPVRIVKFDHNLKIEYAKRMLMGYKLIVDGEILTEVLSKKLPTLCECLNEYLDEITNIKANALISNANVPMSSQEIASSNKQVHINSKYTCTVCRKEYTQSANFCSECGGKIVCINIPQTFLCSKCSKEYQSGIKFCPECGGKIEIKTL